MIIKREGKFYCPSLRHMSFWRALSKGCVNFYQGAVQRMQGRPDLILDMIFIKSYSLDTVGHQDSISCHWVSVFSLF